MTPTQMRAFNAVARCSGFSRAAEDLGVSQPAITAQIRALEGDYDVLLFERRGRVAVTLTDTGRALFRITQAMEDVEAEAVALLTQGRGRPAGVLRIATASPEVLMPMVARVHRAAPGLKMDIWVGGTGEALERLVDREADLGLFALPPEAFGDQLTTLRLVEQRLCAMLPAVHPLAIRGTPVALADLAAEPMIFRAETSQTQQMANRALAERGFSVQPILRLDNRMAANEAVAAGLGACFVLQHDAPRDARVRVLPLADVDSRVWETLCYLHRRGQVAAIRRFIEALDET